MFILLLAFTGLSINAQVTLEHTYNFSGTLVETDNGEFKYFVMDVPLNQCRIYNDDHSLYNTINLNVPAGYYLYDVKFVSRHIFDSDDSFELLYIYSRTTVINSQSVNEYNMKVINEDGSVLMTLDDGGYAEIMNSSDGLKLLAYQYIFYDYYYLVYTNVYALGGTAKATSALSEARLKVYPNPVGNMLNVSLAPALLHSSGQLQITDMSGRTVIDQSLHTESNTINLEDKKMPAGTYILKVVPGQGTPLTEKIIKN